jgi:hypothetical protein
MAAELKPPEFFSRGSTGKSRADDAKDTGVASGVTVAPPRTVFSPNSAIDYFARVNGTVRLSRGRRSLESI